MRRVVLPVSAEENLAHHLTLIRKISYTNCSGRRCEEVEEAAGWLSGVGNGQGRLGSVEIVLGSTATEALLPPQGKRGGL